MGLNNGQRHDKSRGIRKVTFGDWYRSEQGNICGCMTLWLYWGLDTAPMKNTDNIREKG
jgi:hypothetical protein